MYQVVKGVGMSEENEELDVVKSLELTAEGSYDEGYHKGRKEGIEVGFGGQVRKVEAFALRPIDGRGAPQYCLRIDVEYDNMVDRDEAAERLKE